MRMTTEAVTQFSTLPILTVTTQPTRTVAIVGTHTGTRHLAPFDDLDIDIWVFNEAGSNAWAKRVTAVFQMHAPYVYRSTHNRSDPDHYKWLTKEHGFPVYMQESYPQIPDSVRYPLDEIVATLGCERYFTSSVAYALALAGYLDYEKVLLYGVEMSSNTEYHYQRRCVLYWLGFLQGRGIEIERHSGQGLFDGPLYGYDGILLQDVSLVSKRMKELRDQAARATKERHKAAAQLDVCYLKEENPSEAIGNLSDKSHACGLIEGGLDECKRYLRILTDMSAKNGSKPFIDRNELEGAAGQAKEHIEEQNAMKWRTAGRLDYVLEVWLQTKDPRALKQVKDLANKHIKANYDYGFTLGVYGENHRMASDLDTRIQAAGGERAYKIILEN